MQYNVATEASPVYLRVVEKPGAPRRIHLSGAICNLDVQMITRILYETQSQELGQQEQLPKVMGVVTEDLTGGRLKWSEGKIAQRLNFPVATLMEAPIAKPSQRAEEPLLRWVDGMFAHEKNCRGPCCDSRPDLRGKSWSGGRKSDAEVGRRESRRHRRKKNRRMHQEADPFLVCLSQISKRFLSFELRQFGR